MQADTLGLPVAAGRADATALGAALLAGVGAGVWSSVEEAAAGLEPGRVVTPRTEPAERERERRRWRRFVETAAELG